MHKLIRLGAIPALVGLLAGAVGGSLAMWAHSSPNDWLGFYGSVLGGLLTVAAGWFALSAVDRERKFRDIDAAVERARAVVIVRRYLEALETIANMVIKPLHASSGHGSKSVFPDPTIELVDDLRMRMRQSVFKTSSLDAEISLQKLPEGITITTRAAIQAQRELIDQQARIERISSTNFATIRSNDLVELWHAASNLHHTSTYALRLMNEYEGIHPSAVVDDGLGHLS